MEYDYDAAGNLILDAENKRFVYDAENRQTQFFGPGNQTTTPDATYHYDGDGKRVKKVSATETTVFVYNGAGILVAEYSTALNPTPRTSYLTADNLGSPRIVTDQLGTVVARHDYTAFGNDVAETLGPVGGRTGPHGVDDKVRKRYTGYERDDESGLEFAQARYYNADHGRYTSPDPLAASALIRDPQTFNRYSYVLNSPYNFTDPLGLLPEKTTNYIGGSSLVDRILGGFSDNIKRDLWILQFHVANGTALGHSYINAVTSRQSAGCPECPPGTATTSPTTSPPLPEGWTIQGGALVKTNGTNDVGSVTVSAADEDAAAPRKKRGWF